MRTVEGTIREGLVRVGAIERSAPLRLAVASRTDRGVSARANALTLESHLAGVAVLRALNGIAPEIRFTGASAVPDEFRVRSPLWREYRYFLPEEFPRSARWDSWLSQFVGQPIDVRSFARGVPAGAPHFRTLDALELRTESERTILRVRAPGFLWGMVRKIVSALQFAAAGEITETELRRALRGEDRLSLPLAPPEGLVLWEVRYAQPWQFEHHRSTREQGRWLAEERARSDARRQILPRLFEETSTPTSA